MSNTGRLYASFMDAELWFVAIAVLAGMLSAPALIVAPMVGLIFAIIRLVVDKRLPGPTPVDLAILIFIFIGLINITVSAIPANTKEPLYRLLGGIALFFGVVHWGRSIPRLRALIAITAIAALGLCLLSAFTVSWVSYKLFFIPTSIYQRLPTLITDTIHPNVLAGSLIAITPLIVAIILFSIKKITIIERLLYFLVLIAICGALLLSQSRGAILALLITLFVVFLLRSPWFWLLPAVGIIVAGIVVFRMGIVEVNTQIVKLFSLAGFGQRTDIWRHTLFILQDFPLTGVGMGNFSDTFRILYPLSMSTTNPLPHAHNIFLQVGTDLGVPGLLFWLVIVVTGLFAAWRVYKVGKKWQQPWILAIGAGLFGSQLAIIIHGMLDSVLWSEVRTAPLVWWLWGMTMAALNLVSRSQKHRARQEVLPGAGSKIVDHSANQIPMN